MHLINPTGAPEAGQPSQTSYAPVARALCNAIAARQSPQQAS
ncbi:hypothetical protein ACFQDJ_30465 [Pseudomonas brassicacearum]